MTLFFYCNKIIMANEPIMGRVLYYMLNFRFSKRLEGLYRRKFELKDLISHASTNRELEDMRLYSDKDEVSIRGEVYSWAWLRPTPATLPRA